MSHVLSKRLSDLLAGRKPEPRPKSKAQKLAEAKAAAAATKVKRPDLPTDYDHAFGKAAAAFAVRLTVAVEHLRVAEHTTSDYAEITKARAARVKAEEAAAAAQRCAEAAVQPLDVRELSGLTTVPAVALYDTVKALWNTIRPDLSEGTIDAICKANPIPPRPARIKGLLAAVQHYARVAERAAGPEIDVVKLTRDARAALAGTSPPALVRPPAGYLNADGQWADANAEDEIDDMAESDDGAKTGYQHFCGRIKAGHFAGLYFGDFRMPGNGWPNRECGNFLRVKGCTSDDHVAMGVHADTAKNMPYICGRIACPMCFDRVIDRMAARICERIDGFSMLRRSDLTDQETPRRRIPLHCTLSLPESLYQQAATTVGLKSLNKTVRERLKRVGLEASVVIYHPFRFKKSAKGEPYYSPHFHVIAFGWVDYAKVAAAHDEDGWIFKKIRVMRTVEHTRSCVRYILSHVGVAEDADSYRFFAQLGYRKFAASSVLDAQLESTEAFTKVLKERSGGKYPMFDPALFNGTAPGAPDPVPVMVSVRLYDRPDASRLTDEGRAVTETRLDDCHEVPSARIDMEVATKADMEALAARLARSAHRDYPAFPPINHTDVGPDGLVPEERQRQAAGLDSRLPPQRVFVIRTSPIAPSMAGMAPSSGPAEAPVAPTSPTKSRRKRYLTIILRPNLSDLCMICRRQLHLCDAPDDSWGDFPSHVEWELDVPILVPRDRLKPLDVDGPSVKIYSRETGASAYDYRLIAEPVHFVAYPPHVQAQFKEACARADKSLELFMATGKRPSRKAVVNALAREAAVKTAALPGLADRDERRRDARGRLYAE